jgi:hypothetical protein
MLPLPIIPMQKDDPDASSLSPAMPRPTHFTLNSYQSDAQDEFDGSVDGV